MSGQLKERYVAEVVPALRKQFDYTNPNQVPRLDKIVVNIGLGEALTNAKAVDAYLGPADFRTFLAAEEDRFVKIIDQLGLRKK